MNRKKEREKDRRKEGRGGRERKERISESTFDLSDLKKLKNKGCGPVADLSCPQCFLGPFTSRVSSVVYQY
jgi:hypothetical protein